MKAILVAVVVLSLVGCASTKGTGYKPITPDIVKFDQQNAAETRKLARQFMATWSLNSGFIRGAMGEEAIKKLPYDVVISMDDLDQLAKKPPEQLTDYELGYSLGVRVRAMSKLVMAALQQYAPDVLQYLPALFGM